MWSPLSNRQVPRSSYSQEDEAWGSNTQWNDGTAQRRVTQRGEAAAECHSLDMYEDTGNAVDDNASVVTVPLSSEVEDDQHCEDELQLDGSVHMSARRYQSRDESEEPMSHLKTEYELDQNREQRKAKNSEKNVDAELDAEFGGRDGDSSSYLRQGAGTASETGVRFPRPCFQQDAPLPFCVEYASSPTSVFGPTSLTEGMRDVSVSHPNNFPCILPSMHSTNAPRNTLLDPPAGSSPRGFEEGESSLPRSQSLPPEPLGSDSLGRQEGNQGPLNTEEPSAEEKRWLGYNDLYTFPKRYSLQLPKPHSAPPLARQARDKHSNAAAMGRLPQARVQENVESRDSNFAPTDTLEHVSHQSEISLQLEEDKRGVQHHQPQPLDLHRYSLVRNRSPAFKVVLSRRDYKFIQTEVLKCQNLETGGDLFGQWQPDGSVLIHHATGPGRNARRSRTTFNQDVEFMQQAGSLLRAHQSFHVGDWHSHHRIGLKVPSGGDDNTCVSALRQYDRQWFIQFICNIHAGNVYVHPYRYTNNAQPHRHEFGMIHLCSNEYFGEERDSIHSKLEKLRLKGEHESVEKVGNMEDTVLGASKEEDTHWPSNSSKFSLETATGSFIESVYSYSTRTGSNKTQYPSQQKVVTDAPKSERLRISQEREAIGATSVPQQSSSEVFPLKLEKFSLVRNRSPAFKVVLSRRDYKFIQTEVLKYQNLETGGDLFGQWQPDGSVLIHHATGPGRNARRSRTTFNQDVEFMQQVGSLLRAHQSFHVGDWHSHHRIGLKVPSGGDDNTCVSALRQYDRQWFIQFICNIHAGNVYVHPYRYTNNAQPHRHEFGMIHLCSNEYFGKERNSIHSKLEELRHQV